MNKTPSNGRLLSSVESILPASMLRSSGANSDMSSIIHMMERLLHWAAVIESSDDAIISLSVDGNITGWNTSAERLYGYKSDDILGKPVSILMPTQKVNDFPLIMNQLREGKKIEHYKTQRKTNKGRLIDVSITASPIRDTSGNLIGVTKIAHDISESLENERRRDEFVSIVSHELKTPIASQKIYGELLQQQLQKSGDAQHKKLIDKIIQQTQKLENLVNDLLELSRMQMGRINLEYKTFDMCNLIKEVIDDMQKAAQHKIIFESKKQIKLNADRARVTQVMTNLISNAIKYSPEADKVIVEVVEEKDEVVISIKDFGIGIQDEYKQKIFERFFRISNKDETTYPGMGIGLNLSAEIVNLHDGRIWVESELDKGSTFFFALPKERKEKTKEAA